MHEIVIVSGKGGTGKTSLLGAFAHLAEDKVICDLDVDAPDLHLLLHPTRERVEDFYSGYEPQIDDQLCNGCGLCVSLCRFGAIRQDKERLSVDPRKCEGCKVCVTFCPVSAINFPRKHCGQWYVSSTRFGHLVHAQLIPGAENSGRLVMVLKKQARELAEANNLKMVLCDGTPGIGCPVISSLSGTDLAVVVTEPTPSGRHDLERVADLCRHFKVPVAVIINKCDLNATEASRIDTYCQEMGYFVMAHLPHDPVVTKAMIQGRVVTELPETDFSVKLREAWERIGMLLQGAVQSR